MYRDYRSGFLNLTTIVLSRIHGLVDESLKEVRYSYAILLQKHTQIPLKLFSMRSEPEFVGTSMCLCRTGK